MISFGRLIHFIKSPFIYPTIKADWLIDRERGIIFRKFKKKGCLRDIIWKSNPIKQNFQQKYKEKGNALTEKRIATWGRHILEGMNYLRLKGFPAGNVHCGNIMVEKNICKISDYENKILNLVPFQSDIAFNPSLRKRRVDSDVICFGTILFEMVSGYVMDAVDLQEAPNSLINSKSILEILEWIFWPTTKEDNEKPPLLKELLELKFFSKVEMPKLEAPPKIKLGKKGKEMLKMARQSSILNPNSNFSPSQFGQLNKGKQRASQKINSQSSNWKETEVSTSKPNSSNNQTVKNENQQKPPKNDTVQQNPPKISSPPPNREEVVKDKPQDQPGRDDLLSSIGTFSKTKLKKAVTNDRSAPIIENKK